MLTEISRQRRVENRLRRVIGRAQDAAAIEPEHAGGQAFEQRFQIGALIFGFFRALPHARTCQFQFALHLIE